MSVYRSIGVHDVKGLKASFLFIITGPLRERFHECLMVNTDQQRRHMDNITA